MSRTTLAVIVGNRDFFPDRLITEGRADILSLFSEMDIEPVILGENDTKLGAVETWQHARRCADLFAANRGRIEGVLVTLPNFGDEKGVADTLKLSGLNVPVLVQAYPDDVAQFTVERRRDAFCGKVSVCNNLTQYGIPFTLTTRHTVHPTAPGFREDLRQFAATCKVANGMRNVRLGAIGARPNAFNTTRYSEKLLQSAGISVSTLDLSELFGAAGRLTDSDAKVGAKLEEIRGYARHNGVPGEALLKMAKLAVAMEEWMARYDIQATALQCWNSIQQNFGVNACTIMSMMSEKLMPSACEVDITGLAAMYALQLASGTPSALVDWNNNYGDDPDKCVFCHFGNWAKAF
ncbi:MAG: fucose isomerase, partial [Candidatus Solibacter sp.]|nr:fucose isomerase [Candidatus Solibacter sp.]